jgi:hypothetical protein
MREGMERNPARNDKGKISKNQQKWNYERAWLGAKFKYSNWGKFKCGPFSGPWPTHNLVKLLRLPNDGGMAPLSWLLDKPLKWT